VIGSLRQHHRATEFKKFLVQIDEQVPKDLDVHLILDLCRPRDYADSCAA
jgi:hypothetical protein